MQYMQQEKLLHVHKSTETSIESSIETTENIHSDLIHSRAWLKPCIDLNLEQNHTTKWFSKSLLN